MKKCLYCNKKLELKKKNKGQENLCSEKCKDNYVCAVGVSKVKGIIMDMMREVSGKKKRREKIFLEGLITCLKFDLKERGG